MSVLNDIDKFMNNPDKQYVTLTPRQNDFVLELHIVIDRARTGINNACDKLEIPRSTKFPKIEQRYSFTSIKERQNYITSLISQRDAMEQWLSKATNYYVFSGVFHMSRDNKGSADMPFAMEISRTLYDNTDKSKLKYEASESVLDHYSNPSHTIGQQVAKMKITKDLTKELNDE